jgi:hypothetical protein
MSHVLNGSDAEALALQAIEQGFQFTVTDLVAVSAAASVRKEYYQRLAPKTPAARRRGGGPDGRKTA